MKKFAIEIKWAILFAVVLLVWMYGERLAGLHDENIEKHAIVTNFFALVAIAVYVVALLDKRKNDFNGKMNWIQGFISGLIITLGVTILTPLTQYLTVEVITPHYFENMIRYAVENGLQTQEEAEGYFNLQSYMIQSIIATPLMGLVTSAIVAIFTRKK
ncbi:MULTISPECIES: DUF4199 domain-containing protein [Draconibacterium]|uniref:Membrane protein n=1 Tax=Draconibacterium sediminis TaxID=1544798 RepID=A0A0D8J5R7_9BACT|nr:MULTISPECIES: DUF4199 domain-containing protein [Draconibacterium]KJF42232.1 membrane protein [Draconibacterium sediminis]